MKNLFALALGALVGVSAAGSALADLSISASTELQRPFSVYNSTGVTTYNAASRQFTMTATLLATRFDGVEILLPLGQATIATSFRVNSSGNLIGGTTGQPDLVMTGSIDLDNDGIPEYTGTLVTAEILTFGWQEAGATDLFDATFRVTGGTMAGLYGNKIGLTITAEHSSFTGTFCNDFDAGAKGVVGNLNGDNTCPYSPGYWKNHRTSWPLSTLTVGGVAYNSTQIANLLNNRFPNGQRALSDASARLAKFTITSKFDLLSGADDPANIVELISLADAFLAAHPPGSTLTADEADYANDLADDLNDFVNSNPNGCHGGTRCNYYDDDCSHYGSGCHSFGSWCYGGGGGGGGSGGHSWGSGCHGGGGGGHSGGWGR